MSYFFATTLPGTMESVEETTRAALKEKGFGVLTEIDIKATLKAKLDKDLDGYKVLGACHPPSAYEAISSEPHIGLMLPCNVVLRDVGDGQIEVSAIDPAASMQAVDNNSLGAVAMDVRSRLQEVISGLGS